MSSILSLARSRLSGNYVFPMEFKVSTSSGKMAINPKKLPDYMDTRIIKMIDPKGLFGDEVAQKIKDSFKSISNPEIYEDLKPRFTIGAIFNAETKETSLMCFSFLKSGKGLRITHQFVTSEEGNYPKNWIFLVNFGTGDEVLSLVNEGIEAEAIPDIMGSAIKVLIPTIPELSDAFNQREL